MNLVRSCDIGESKPLTAPKVPPFPVRPISYLRPIGYWLSAQACLLSADGMTRNKKEQVMIRIGLATVCVIAGFIWALIDACHLMWWSSAHRLAKISAAKRGR